MSRTSASVTTLDRAATRPLLFEGVLDILAGVFRLLADLPCGPAKPLSLPLHFKVRVAGRAAGLRLGPAFTHAEPVPQFVSETHAVRLLRLWISTRFLYPRLAKYAFLVPRLERSSGLLTRREACSSGDVSGSRIPAVAVSAEY